MRDLLSDPRLVDALIGLVLAAIAGVGGLGALVYRRVYARLDERLSHVLATSIEARRAAETAQQEIQNNHETNVRDDLDRAIETTWSVGDQVSEVGATARELRETLLAHGEQLDAISGLVRAVDERVGRVDRRQAQIAEEIHDERVARESSQRSLDEQAHDTHVRLWKRLDALADQVAELRGGPGLE